MPNFRRHFAPGQTVFLTIVTARRRPWLRSPAAKQHVLLAMARVHGFHPYRHLAHVLLDDHLHWLVEPETPTLLPNLVASFKRDLSRRRGPIGATGPLWQPRYYDHIIRDADDLRRHLDYVHYNPVRHGHVQSAAEYGWSSLKRWIERGHYTPDWGFSEPQSIKGMALE